MKKNKWKLLMTIWDILFVLVLCFAILLTTMLVSRSAEQTAFEGYVIHPALLIGVVLSITLYLSFLLHASRKGLCRMVAQFFSAHPAEEKEETVK